MRTDRTASRNPRAARLTPLAAALAVVLAPGALAAPIFVTNNLDSGAGSLRQAILDANANCGSDNAPVITLTGAFTIAPSSPLPALQCFSATPYNPTIDATSYGGTLQGPAGFASCGLDYQYNFTYGGSFMLKGLTIKGFTYGGDAAGVCGSGLTLLGNTLRDNNFGVRAFSGASNFIGGPLPADRNIIIGNDVQGIEITGTTLVTGNFIGTANGTTASPNGTGIWTNGPGGVQITNNVISGNTDAGIHLFIDYGGTFISNNRVGVKDGATGVLGNGGGGIRVDVSSGATIENNVIGGNSVAGIDLSDSAVFIDGNFIGTDPSGSASLPNTVGINAFCSGYFGIDSNTIANNQTHGINLASSDAVFMSSNLIKNNGGSGIRISGGLDCGYSGEWSEMSDNEITGNAQNGVHIQGGGLGSPVAHRVLRGSITGNGVKNINLSGSTTLPNDPGDEDGGSNNQQNWPVITSVVQADGGTVVTFTLDYGPANNYQIQAYANSAMGKPGGQTYVGETTICGDCGDYGGQIFIDGLFDNISLTATDTSSNETSEFSPMAAAVTAPAVLIAPSPLNFGEVLVGSSSAERTITVRSIGGQPWMIDNINSDGFCYGFPICYGGAFMCSTTCETETEYATGQTCQIKATFAPNFTGFQQTQIQFCDNTASGSNSVTLTGIGVPPPPLTLTPSHWDFGGVPVGETSATRAFTLRHVNDYGGDVEIVISTTGEFDVVNHDCGDELDWGDECNILVTFGPTTPGAATGELRVTYQEEGEVAQQAKAEISYGGGMLRSTLTGTGLSGGELQLPSGVNVGAAVFGGQAVSTLVTITNNGAAAANIASISVSGPFTLVNNCPAVLEPAQSCTLTIGFTAPGVGEFTGTLTVVSDSGSAEIPVTAAGQTALTPLLRVEPVTMGFGDRLIGSLSPTQQVVITNIGGAPATLALTSSTIDFMISGNSCGATLEVSASCTAQVAFRPLGFGTRTGSVIVTSNTPNSPQAVMLGGTGCRPFMASGNRIGEVNNCAP